MQVTHSDNQAKCLWYWTITKNMNMLCYLLFLGMGDKGKEVNETVEFFIHSAYMFM